MPSSNRHQDEEPVRLPVIARSEELGAIRRFLSRVPNQGSVLVLEGDPGIGKTTLWRHTVESARSAFVNTMVMAILERTREIGVMRACGATRAMVRLLFTFEAAVLGFFGGAIGLALGYGLTFIANGLINKQLQASAIAVANVISIPAWLILVVLGATTGIGVLAGLGPAAGPRASILSKPCATSKRLA